MQRFLSALKATWLVKDGFAEQAEEHWQAARLPPATEEILDLHRQTWREMEAVACARIRLFAAQGRLDAARALVEALCRTAEERQLRRVLMNGIALSMAVEYALGVTANAVADLADFLRIGAVTGYLRPMARERETTLEVLPALLATAGEADVHDAAAQLRDDLDAPVQGPIFTAREMAIVRRVAWGTATRRSRTRWASTRRAWRSIWPPSWRRRAAKTTRTSPPRRKECSRRHRKSRGGNGVGEGRAQMH